MTEHAASQLDTLGADTDRPVANGHRWPCTGYYAAAHAPGFTFTCTCNPTTTEEHHHG